MVIDLDTLINNYCLEDDILVVSASLRAAQGVYQMQLICPTMFEGKYNLLSIAAIVAINSLIKAARV